MGDPECAQDVRARRGVCVRKVELGCYLGGGAGEGGEREVCRWWRWWSGWGERRRGEGERC